MSDLGTSANIELSMFKGANRKLAAALIEIVGDMRNYWPLTVRQVYYQAVSRLVIPNSQAKYRAVSRCVTDLRRDDLLPWHAIEDRTRRTMDKRGISNVQEFIHDQMDTFLNPQYYQRCTVQEQDVYVEVVIEKDALAGIIEGAVWPYCTRLNIGRGQISATMVNSIAERFDAAIWKGKQPVLIYMGDLDPSGIAIPKTLQRSLLEHHSVEVELVRVGLNPDQVAQYQLPEDPTAAKKTDSNYKAWLAEYGPGQSAVELDALHPETLINLIQEALENVYDMSEIAEQKAKEAEERKFLAMMRRRVEDVVWDEFRDAMAERR